VEYLREPARRQAIAAAQRASVVSRFSYEAGMRRVVREMGRRLGARIQRDSALIGEAKRDAA